MAPGNPALSSPRNQDLPRFGESGERIRSARVRSARSARSARSRPGSASSSLAGEMGDVPPDGPVDMDALEVNS